MRKRTFLVLAALVAVLVLSFAGADATTLKCYHNPSNPDGGNYNPDNWVERKARVDIDMMPGPYAASAGSNSAMSAWKICIDENPND